MTSIPDHDEKAPRSVVYTRIMDGLGNQLFQYAAGRALADRLGVELRLDCGWFSQNSSRVFELDAFSINAVRDDEVRKVPSRWFKLPTRTGKRWTAAIHGRWPRSTMIGGQRCKVFDEKRIYVYDPAFAALTGSVYLTGWWQSPRYFESSADTIRRELHPAAPLPETSLEWTSRIRQVMAVAVHVRRGDYLLSPDRATCPKAYYDQAMDLMRSRLPGAHFFVFSDDPVWCADNFDAPDATVVDANGRDSAVADLMLMAQCRHHIIANSSFSWWGAWLSDSPGQIVVAPKDWVIGIPTTDDFKALRWKHFFRL